MSKPKYSSPDERMRRKVIALWCQCGYGFKTNEEKQRFHNFMLKSSVLKKPLNDYEYHELIKLVTQFELMLENTENSPSNAKA